MKYYDIHGVEIKEGSIIIVNNCINSIYEVFATINNNLYILMNDKKYIFPYNLPTQQTMKVLNNKGVK